MPPRKPQALPRGAFHILRTSALDQPLRLYVSSSCFLAEKIRNKKGMEWKKENGKEGQ
jgi:hypothetical protein